MSLTAFERPASGQLKDGDLDLRLELARLLDGDGLWSGKGAWYVHRHVIRTKRTQSFAESAGYKEADRKQDFGLTLVTRDLLRRAFMQKLKGGEQLLELGIVKYDYAKFWFKYEPQLPNFFQEDSIIELDTNELGRPITPVVTRARWGVQDITLHRGNQGRIEYVSTLCRLST